MTFCHAARKGGYILEVIGLSMFAPLLYSMVNQLLFLGLTVHPVVFGSRPKSSINCGVWQQYHYHVGAKHQQTSPNPLLSRSATLFPPKTCI